MIYSKISSSNLSLPSIKLLYETSFPPEERRDFELIIDLIDKKKEVFHIIAAFNDKNEFLGFISYWSFATFIYVEHFAIEPEQRGNQLGKKFLQYFANSCSLPIILEVEPPTEEMSLRRINFYKRNGFSLLDTPYIQPAYDASKASVELKLMATQKELILDNINSCIETIHANVYGVKHS